MNRCLDKMFRRRERSDRVGPLLGLLLLVFTSAIAGQPATPVCATCHPAQAKSQPQTSMGRALELPADCDILTAHRVLTYRAGPYSYRIERKADTSIYSVTDGQQTLEAPIAYAVGLGSAGQTYIFEKDGEMYQSTVSFYRDIDGLDLTLGARNAKPANITEAAGQIMDVGEKITCFGCHSTGAVEHKQLNLDKLKPGVRCEHCHGDTTNHLLGVKQGNPQMAHMTNLKSLSTEDISNFCGQCHRTWEQIASSGITGVFSVRFQPYRLTKSKCYDTDDPRISCIACHDPHQEVSAVAASYDPKCLGCHSGTSAKGHACKVATSNCASCHMPKVGIPGSHKLFTDHDIRIVRANAPYPS